MSLPPRKIHTCIDMYRHVYMYRQKKYKFVVEIQIENTNGQYIRNIKLIKSLPFGKIQMKTTPRFRGKAQQ